MAKKSPATTSTAAAEPVEIKLALEPGQVIFRVTGNVSSLSHSGMSYPVVNGHVVLPASDSWYDELVSAGILTLP